MNKIALLYAPKGGSVELSAKKIVDIYDGEVDVFSVDEFDIHEVKNYQNIIMGCSTVGAENWQDASTDNEWDAFFFKLDENKLDLKEKTVAIFGLGNQVLYPDHFVDAMIILKEASEKAGANVIGAVSVEGYDFTNSDSVVDDKFVGLPLDEDTEEEKSNDRIKAWLEAIQGELK